MLSDRDYMNYGTPHISSRNNPKTFIYMLMAINVCAYIIAPEHSDLSKELSMRSDVFQTMKLWTIVTSMFLHGGFWHLAMNMWALHLFGTFIINDLGVKKFRMMYFLSGIFGNLLWILFNYEGQQVMLGDIVMGTRPIYVLGASGAVSGILMATAMLRPDNKVIPMFFPTPIKLKTLIIVIALLEILGELSKTDNIAHLAHFGGFIAAYFYIKYTYKGPIWDFLSFLKNKKQSKSKIPKGWSIKSYPASEKVSSHELDAILDKISNQGMDSLTNEEMSKLKRAREDMK